VIEPHAQINGVKRRFDAPPDLVPHDAKVFATESDVVANSGSDGLGFRILQNESDPPAHSVGMLTPDAEGTHLMALVVAKHAGKCAKQRALTRTRWAEQEHALPWRDGERATSDSK
jgi:hypothetical protein